ncbi:hypothetical protein Rctr85_040 [Virus Rctr85]|nr:hypothetical protein Rctr85_040 [Virus Rctr85]
MTPHGVEQALLADIRKTLLDINPRLVFALTDDSLRLMLARAMFTEYMSRHQLPYEVSIKGAMALLVSNEAALIQQHIGETGEVPLVPDESDAEGLLAVALQQNPGGRLLWSALQSAPPTVYRYAPTLLGWLYFVHYRKDRRWGEYLERAWKCAVTLAFHGAAPSVEGW